MGRTAGRRAVAFFTGAAFTGVPLAAAAVLAGVALAGGVLGGAVLATAALATAVFGAAALAGAVLAPLVFEDAAALGGTGAFALVFVAGAGAFLATAAGLRSAAILGDVACFFAGATAVFTGVFGGVFAAAFFAAVFFGLGAFTAGAFAFAVVPRAGVVLAIESFPSDV